MGFDDVQMMLRPHHHTQRKSPHEALNYEYWLDQDGRGEERWDRAKAQLKPKTAHFQIWRSALDEEWHSTSWIGNRAVEMIEEKGDAPLIAWVSFPDPHPPFLAPKPWCNLYSPEEVTIAQHSKLDLDCRPWWHQRFVEDRAKPIKQGAEHNAGGIDWGQNGILDEKVLRDITAIYFGMISAVDAQVDRIFDGLEAKGEMDNTYIVFVSDHGEWLGDHGLLLKGPMLYDGILRVPCLIQGPGIPQSLVVDDPVGSIDILATATDLSEYEVDSLRSAVDMDLLTVRSDRYRMSIDTKTDTGELYDMQEDPSELENLFDDPAYVAVRLEHTDMIRSRPDDIIPSTPRIGWH